MSLPAPLQVKLQLLHGDIMMQPSAPELRKAVASIMSRLHETSQPFVRWMDGTCLEAAAVAGTLYLAVLQCPCTPVWKVCLERPLSRTGYHLTPGLCKGSQVSDKELLSTEATSDAVCSHSAHPPGHCEERCILVEYRIKRGILVS